MTVEPAHLGLLPGFTDLGGGVLGALLIFVPGDAHVKPRLGQGHGRGLPDA
jgi:hypothetical protein